MSTTKTKVLKVTVPGDPITKANATKLGRRRARIPVRFQIYEKKIRDAAEAVMKKNKQTPFKDGPVRIKITYYLENRKVKDLLNLPKTTCDALNEVFYTDDCQIVQAICEKRYDTANPRVVIEVRRPAGQWLKKMKELFWSLPPSYMPKSRRKRK